MRVTDRDTAIDVIKGIGIVGVLFLHASFAKRFSDESLRAIDVVQYYLQWCVVGFFFTAGLLTRAVQTFGDWRRFLRKRAQRLLIPCVAFSLTYNLLLVALTATGRFELTSIPSTSEDWLRLLLTPAEPQLYFLVYLFVISAALELLLLNCRGGLACDLFLLTAVLAAELIRPVVGTITGPDYGLIAIYSAAYLCGALMRRHAGVWPYLIPALTASAFVGLTLVTSNSNIAWAGFPLVLYHGLKVASLASLDQTVGWLGRRSAEIYVWHAPVFNRFISIVVCALLGGGYLAVAITLVATIAVSVLLAQIVNRVPWLWMFRV
jgi:fucose 4-O-acetylase-like acetyltransferase